MQNISVTEELDSIGIREILDHDSRPTFVLDLDPDDESVDSSRNISPVFCNSALQLHETLFDAVIGRDIELINVGRDSLLETEFVGFKKWATGFTSHDDSKDVFPSSFSFRNMLWTGSTVRRRWRLISGNSLLAVEAARVRLSSGISAESTASYDQLDGASDRQIANTIASQENIQSSAKTLDSTIVTSPKPSVLQSSVVPGRDGSSIHTGLTNGSRTSLVLSTPERAVPDWTVPVPKGVLSPHQVFARSIDWEATSVGAMETWSCQFRQLANLVMQNPHPAALFWGPELTMMYNETYAKEVAGNKHPSLMGTAFWAPFSELSEGVYLAFTECARTGISIRKDNDPLPIERHGFLEETFFSWTWTPVYGGTDKIQGFYNAPFETTQQERTKRGLKTIHSVNEKTAQVKTVKRFWKAVLEGLDDNPYEAPFALLYSVGESDTTDDHSSQSSGSFISLKTCHFEGSLGVPEGHPAAPPYLDLKRSREGFVPSFREALRTREPTLLHSRDGTLPEGLLDGVEWRGFGDPCRDAIIFPLRPTNGDAVLAFLLLGIHPRRPYDDEYKAFASLLNRQLATSLASVMLLEEEARKNRDAAEAAALEQEHLSQQLALQTSRLRRMTELSPLGMFLISPDGVSREVNDRFIEMTGISRDDVDEMAWVEFIMPSHTQKMLDGWEQMVSEHIPWSGELHLKHEAGNPVNFDGEAIDYWVLFTAQPEFNSDGSLRSIMGSITDISRLKWAQGLQEQRLIEADERRRQQNEFIDITSHEMRNPLSAILQCADDITAVLEAAVQANTTPSMSLLESCLDSAKTIALCVQHQKSIVDDILTVSKLTANLLVITPSAAQPVAVVQHALKMLDPEVQAKDIRVTFEQDKSLSDLGLSWLMFDASRVLQILINLITNAIKFTAPSTERRIKVTLAASRRPPLEVDTKGFEYVPVRDDGQDNSQTHGSTANEKVYLRFFVEDTGCGLTSEEKAKLFERFSQASPRTHAVYGGSGLGLFISRQLSELLGGRIGAASEAGVGSTFGFFIAAQPAETPSSAPTPAGRGADTEQIVITHRAPVQRLRSESLLAPKDVVEAQTAPAFHPAELAILVVEDNIINQKVLVKQIHQVGSAVIAANDGVEALAHLETTHYRKGESGQPLSIILMDLEMPNMDGLTCVRIIRRMEKDEKIRGRVPIIAVTANVRDEQVAAAMAAGMDDVVSKPFRIADLYKKIEIVLKKHDEKGVKG